MKVLVTGGAGHIGQVTTARLLKHGYTVRVIDHVAPADIKPETQEKIAGADYQQIDICDYAAVEACAAGTEAIVHLAAIPHPLSHPAAEVFHINVTGTYNVYQAAETHNITRLVGASSINFLGNGFGLKMIPIDYFPIDEAHPGFSTDVYAYSKQLLEQTAAFFWRRAKISSICFRFPFVFNPNWFPPERVKEQSQKLKASYEHLMALPETERQQKCQALLNDYTQLRLQRNRQEISFHEMLQFFQDKPGGMLLFGRDDFWSVLHVEDAAQAIEKALQVDFEGVVPLYVTNPHNSTGLPSRDLAQLFYPQVTNWLSPITGAESLLNPKKAETFLGFQAEHADLWNSA